MEERVGMVRLYCKFENAAEKQWRHHFDTDPPVRETILATYQKFLDTGSDTSIAYTVLSTGQSMSSKFASARPAQQLLQKCVSAFATPFPSGARPASIVVGSSC